MSVVAVAACLCVLAAALLVRRGPAACTAWLVGIALALLAIEPLARRVVAGPAVPIRTATLRDGDALAALAAAAAAGPHVADLQLVLGDAVAPPAGDLGASGRLALAPLPFAPTAVSAQLTALAQHGRPTSFDVDLPSAPGWLAHVAVLGLADDAELAAATWPLDGVRQRVSWLPDAPGPHRFVVRLSGDGSEVRLRAGFDVAAANRLLVVAGDDLPARPLRTQGFTVDVLPDLPDDLGEYAAVLLAQAIAPAAQLRLAAAVDDGLGLFVLAPAFGEAGAPLRDLLPLQPAAVPPPRPVGSGDGPGGPPRDPPPEPPPAERPPEPEPPRLPETKEVDKRLVALALVVDRSGSMGNLVHGRTKMSYAKASALRTAAALGPGDEVAVVTFGNRGMGRVELPRTDASELARVREGVEKLTHAAEQTFLLAGLRVAAEELRGSKAVVRHLVVISDGEFHLTESLALRSLANELATRERITLSVIAITDAFTSAEFLSEAELMTRDGGGRFLTLDDAGLVPQLVTAEVTQSLAAVGRRPRDDTAPGSGGPATAPPGPTPEAPKPTPPPPPPRPQLPPPDAAPAELPVVALASSPLLGDEPAAGWPSLAAARAGTARLDAEVLLAAGDDGWPLLAFGNHGLGRVGVFAADLFGADAAAFRQEAAFPARLAQWLAHTLPPLRTPPLPLPFGPAEVEPARPTPAVAAAFAQLASGGVELPGPAASLAAARQPQQLVATPWLPGWLALVGIGLLVLAERRAARQVA